VAGGVAGATDAAPAASALVALGHPSASPVAASSKPAATPAAAAGAPGIDGLAGYRWPLANARLTLPYGPTGWGGWVVDGQKFHDGIDLATFCGDKIVAAHDGVVLAAGRHYDDQMGWIGDLSPYYARLDAKKLWVTLPIVVVIDDGNGYRSVYAHFGKVVVKKGQTVTAGTLLGYEGRTGRASGCHLHYGLFNPSETAQFEMDPVGAKHMKLPGFEIARVDPLQVFPQRTRVPAKPKASTSPAP
jgi:murein DD-endopeptidase MepM/ murein hydrolase activator NlpD